MTFEELGETLRSERERKGLSIEDVSNQLKIGARQLRNLEEGNRADLPHEAYLKGFIRSYAKFLGIGAGEIQDALANLNSVQNTEASDDDPGLEVADSKISRGMILFFALLILGAGAYFAWDNGLLNMIRPEARRTAQPAPPLSQASLERKPKTSPQIGQKAGRSTPNPDLGKSQDQTKSPLSDRAPEPLRTDNKSELAPIQQDQPTTSAQPTPMTPVSNDTKHKEEPQAGKTEQVAPAPAINSSQHKVVVTAIEECWIHSNADKTDTRQFSLRRGETFALTFNKSLELKLGNAGGVHIRYDGEDLPAPGHSGQVKNLFFPPPAMP